MDLGLTDHVYVLTGASRGLGFATAQALVADGAKVVISSRDQARVDQAVADRELSFFSVTSVLGTPLDVTLDELAIEAFLPADAATAEFLRLG